MKAFDLFEFSEEIQIMDIGAAVINQEKQIYNILLEKGIGHLVAFDGDDRQSAGIEDAFRDHNVTALNHFIFDGKRHKLYLCVPETGMSSLFKPRTRALDFFNGFSRFGRVVDTEYVQTIKLDDVENIPAPDLLKMDVQGAELGILKNGQNTLKDCLAIQLEVAFISLYERQPTFGALDVQLRKMGFTPHRFVSIKNWSISPTIFNNNFRIGGNQVLEADMIYVKDPLNLDVLTDFQIKKLAILAHYSFKSVDYCVHLLMELERRRVLNVGSAKTYMECFRNFT